MEKTVITLHSGFNRGPVERRIFGGFIEHLGRCVYEGVYDPGSPLSDPDGLRGDVEESIKQLNYTAMRYPGGNFVSGYHWMDGAGPADSRPKKLDLAWKSIELNLFGTDEYIRLCRRMGWEPMITVNLGTAGPEEARNWVEYCNCPAGTKYADMRVSNGHKEPYGVKLWCLGNEMDGSWQLGHVPAKDYAIRAQQTAKLIKDLYPPAELVVCGSCGDSLPTYMEWDAEVLSYVGEWADYVSLHRYAGNRSDNTPEFLAETNAIDKQIDNMDAVCRFVSAKRKSNKRLYLCFDEWNVWYRQQAMDGAYKFAPHLLEEWYNMEDAIVAAGFLNSFIRRADVVKIANIAQIVNVIAPVMTAKESLVRQTLWYVLKMYAQRREGVSLVPAVSGPEYDGGRYGDVKYVDCSAILGEGVLHVFLSNRSLENEMEVELDLPDICPESVLSAEILTDSDPKAGNTFEHPQRVVSTGFEAVSVKENKIRLKMPRLSVTGLSIKTRV
jgi:alpha-L-arabinofuranosidase